MYDKNIKCYNWYNNINSPPRRRTPSVATLQYNSTRGSLALRVMAKVFSEKDGEEGQELWWCLWRWWWSDSGKSYNGGVLPAPMVVMMIPTMVMMVATVAMVVMVVFCQQRWLSRRQWWERSSTAGMYILYVIYIMLLLIVHGMAGEPSMLGLSRQISQFRCALAQMLFKNK